MLRAVGLDGQLVSYMLKVEQEIVSKREVFQEQENFVARYWLIHMNFRFELTCHLEVGLPQIIQIISLSIVLLLWARTRARASNNTILTMM